MWETVCKYIEEAVTAASSQGLSAQHVPFKSLRVQYSHIGVKLHACAWGMH